MSQVALIRDKLKIKYQEIIKSVDESFDHILKKALIKRTFEAWK